MAKIRELYIWVAFFILVIAIAAYFRYYYQPELSLNVSFVGNSGSSFYPYQQISAPILVQNTGSSQISNLSFGLYINNNLTRTYKITIPTGKAATVDFNFTPGSPGVYKMQMLADPSDLYNIQNRSKAQASLVINVVKPEAADPQAMFSSNGLIGEDLYNMSAQGYGFSLFLFNNTGAYQFSLTQSQKINDLIYPVLDVYYNYIKDISIAHAYYSNYSLVSIWLQGYLNSSSIAAVAVGKGFNVTSSGNLTVINFGGNTTMCTWYSDGWVKSLGSINGSSCTKFVGALNYNSISSLKSSAFAYRNYSIYNYTGFYKNYNYTGQWTLVNKTFLFQSVEKGTNFTNVCYGSIAEFNNISYCTTYYIEAGNVILTKTNALLGTYNFTTWTLNENLSVRNESVYDAKLIDSYNVTAPSATFVSGYVSDCVINEYVGCGVAWNYSTLSISLVNDYNASIYVKGIACFIAGVPNYTTINQTIAPGGYAYIQTKCYDNGTSISGVPLGLSVYLDLKYNELDQSVIADGDAQLVN